MINAKIEFFAIYLMTDIRRETFALVTLLVPTAMTFRAVQCAREWFHVDAQHQMMVRTRLRRLVITRYARSTSYTQMVGAASDGVCVTFYASGVRTRSYWVGDVRHGRYICWDWGLRERCDYREGERRGSRMRWTECGNEICTWYG